jgi:hypothetical protein
LISGEQQVIRSAIAPGDVARAWPSFLDIVPFIDATTRARYEAQVLRAGAYARRFQYPGGIWVNAQQASPQIIDDTEAHGTPMWCPTIYIWGMSQSFRASSLSASDRDDTLAVLNTMRRITLYHFRPNVACRPLSGLRRPNLRVHQSRIFRSYSDVTGGTEWRFLNNCLFILDSLKVAVHYPILGCKCSSVESVVSGTVRDAI